VKINLVPGGIRSSRKDWEEDDRPLGSAAPFLDLVRNWAAKKGHAGAVERDKTRRWSLITLL